jgi:hypothetical protein
MNKFQSSLRMKKQTSRNLDAQLKENLFEIPILRTHNNNFIVKVDEDTKFESRLNFPINENRCGLTLFNFEVKEKNKEIRRLKKIIRKKNLIIRQKILENKALKREFEEDECSDEEEEIKEGSNIIMINENEENVFDSFYDDDIDPDNMTYEELLELQERIGFVCKGFSEKEIKRIPKVKYSTKKAKTKKYDEMCTICQYKYKSGEELRFLNCNHSFHLECVDPWFKKEKICPNCKIEVVLI